MADFSIITPRLATGASLTSVDDAQAVLAAGITHILDLTSAEDDQTFLTGLAIPYLYNPTPDDGQQKPASWWDASLRFAVTAYNSLGACLLCHCSAGVNRGPSTAYGVLRACCGLTGDMASSMVKAVRPQVVMQYNGQFDAYWAGAYPGKVRA